MYWGPVEMKHRVLTTLCILTKSNPDHFTGVIFLGTLSVQDFIEANIAVTEKPLTEQYKKHIDKVFCSKQKKVKCSIKKSM